MKFIRSLLFMLIMTLITIPCAFIAVACRVMSRQRRYAVITQWSVICTFFIRHLLGIHHRVIGLENLPATPVVVLCKHQSAWETIVLQRILPPIAFVLKRELLRIPFFGWGLAAMPIVSIDRSAGKDALRQVVEQGQQRLAEGFSVVIFPEGTRASIGSQKRYKAGGASLAVAAAAPVLPIAHNAGEFWRKNAFIKSPGQIIVSIGPLIETAGRSADEVNAAAEAWIEGEMRRLFPHHYTASAASTAATAQA